MHGITQFLHKHHSRESTPPLDKDDTDSWYSSLSSADSRNSMQSDGPTRSMPIAQRGSYTQRSLRGPSGSPFEFASSPRDRYPNFASYFREVMESRNTTAAHHPDYKRQRSDGERHQLCNNSYHASRNHFLSPLFNEVMDDIQENEYSKCDRYGEISSTKLNHISYKSRFDNKSFAQKLAESVREKELEKTERRDSGSSGSGHKHKHSIQELIRTFGKKVGSWRHEGTEGRRGSCAVPVMSSEEARAVIDPDEFRSRSKSLDGDHLHRVLRRPLLEDCGATYQIFDTILKEGNKCHIEDVTCSSGMILYYLFDTFSC